MTTVGRNEKCPCGSGKKYKNCCAQLDAAKAGLRDRAEKRTTFKITRAQKEGLEHFNAGRVEEAKSLFEEIVSVEPDHADALYMLGVISSRASEDEAALEFVHKALRISPRNLTYLVNYGIMLDHVGHYEDAEKALRRALSQKPGDANILFRLGSALQNQKKLAEAAAFFTRVLTRQPNHAMAQLNLAHVLLDQGLRPEALKHYRATLKIDPTIGSAHWGVAGILSHDGRTDEAKVHMDYFYKAKNLFVSTSKTAVRTVLMTADAGTGNVPFEFLFPENDNNIVKWMAQYATEGQEKELPPYDLVFNAAGNPDAEPFSATVMAYLENCGKRVLNWPGKIPRTARERMSEMFGDIEGLCIPSMWRIEKADDWDAIGDDDLPILTRPIGTQGGIGLTLIDTPLKLAQSKVGNAKLYVSTYFDYRQPDGYYRKYRIIFVDRKPFPYHLAISEKWLVHYYSANMESVAFKLEEERRFLEDPSKVLGPAGVAAIEEVGRRLDLDYAGVDFSILPDGRLLIFEANATMRVHTENEHSLLSFKNPHVQRISDAFNILLLKEGPAGP